MTWHCRADLSRKGARPTHSRPRLWNAWQPGRLACGKCGRCGGPAGPDGGWCNRCIAECRDYTQQLDLRQLPELNTEPLDCAAIFYARAGIPVHPLVPGCKVPVTKNGVLDATTDTRRIRSWWRACPDYNIGLACGVVFDVLDIDIKDGKPGYESLTRLRLAGLALGAWAAAGTPTGYGNHSNGASGLDFRVSVR
jgi:hypothetical protein